MHQDPLVLTGKSLLHTWKVPHPVKSASSETGSWKPLNSSEVLVMSVAQLSSAPPAQFFPCHSDAQEHLCGPAVKHAGKSTEFHSRYPMRSQVPLLPVITLLFPELQATHSAGALVPAWHTEAAHGRKYGMAQGTAPMQTAPACRLEGQKDLSS